MCTAEAALHKQNYLHTVQSAMPAINLRCQLWTPVHSAGMLSDDSHENAKQRVLVLTDWIVQVLAKGSKRTLACHLCC